ncbi:AAA family ATPase [Leptolyngbya sp. FACHB-321]|uniref:ParA family protein n=1 Tax=Leptolyngbya sp. FACHB-321 TaxID=2692807 RepID=UPI001685B62D|nr:ParA family protein [Leptolyngbya sp. FACHB-321]MBD2036922.1 AAA family ATPase [Leptolyngbya sp. FACHB-321]
MGTSTEGAVLMDWSTVLANIPPQARETDVCTQFVPYLLEALGFGAMERAGEFATGAGSDCVDFAARKNTADDVFLFTKNAPFLMVEVKGRATGAGSPINLTEGSVQYVRTREQLKRYLLAPNSKSVYWGIITNATHIQLFRHHGRVVIPATKCIEITSENIEAVISNIKKLIEYTIRSLSVCVYNNKGGVGKTTTTINLAATLATQKKKVLLVDFDSQRDLTTSLGLQPNNIKLSECLKNRALDIRSTIVPYKLVQKASKVYHIFDVIPADLGMEAFTQDTQARVQKASARLRDLLKPFINEYDYILIDCPTQWVFFSQSGLYASDAVLIPTRHDDLSSLRNAARVVQEFVPKVKELRQDGGPISLPIFFNGSPSGGRSIDLARGEIEQIIREGKTASNFNLAPYFFPKIKPGDENKTVFNLPDYAVVSSSAFARVPAVLKNKKIHEYYLALAREYFLND